LKELKMEIESIKKGHRETTLGIKNQRKRQGDFLFSSNLFGVL